MAASADARPNVARAGGIMMLSLLLSRILGTVRDMVMAGLFGSTRYTDAYGLAFAIPDLLFFLIAGGALSSAFIPVFSEYLHTDREDEAWHVFSVVTTVMSIAVAVLIVAAWVFAEPLAHLVAPGKSPELVPLIALMSRIVLPAQFAFFIGGLMFGTLYARQVFAAPGLGPNVYNVCIIGGAIFLSGFFSPGIIGMSWGALIGAFVGNIAIPYLAMRRLGSHFSFSLDLKHPGVRKVFVLMLPVVLGLSLPGVYALIMRGFASFYRDGVNTYIDLSNRLMQAPLGILGQSLAIAVFPALSQYFAQKRMDLYRGQLAASMRTVVYLSVPVSVLMAALAPQIVGVLYHHGHFTAEDTAAVAALLRAFCIGIFAWCLHPVLMRGFFAIQHTRTPIVIGTLTTVLFVGLVLVLRTTSLGVLSLPLASSVSAILLAIGMTIAAQRKLEGLDWPSVVRTLALSALASVPVWGLGAFALASPFGSYAASGKGPMVAFVLVVGGVCAALYLGLTVMLKMPESDYVRRTLRRARASLGYVPPESP
ncbi:MAG: murein biosynthesis integral membrane protein MurJ [Fimbriimonas ginsengisoli]|uniref:Probable lipid II flippase MurJ n=1 Tax=Fimbriimonas ginsengisoli TaxID=1005039 RepID=A0A931LT71_FIMGI|nr:murein biosynthesis integral membrane protein MurJ [Fimbriimonas ginsengisoli]